MGIDTKMKAGFTSEDGRESELKMYVNDKDTNFAVGINEALMVFSHSKVTDKNGEPVAMTLEIEDLEYFIKKMKENK